MVTNSAVLAALVLLLAVFWVGGETTFLAPYKRLLLREHGVWAPAIRPPAVPRGKARLRVTLMATHTQDHLERAIDAFAAARRALRAHGAY